jgi:hypothetical protein
MKFALTWDFAGNIIAQEKLLKAFIGVVRCSSLLFENIIMVIF